MTNEGAAEPGQASAECIEDLIAFGDEEVACALKNRDRDSHQFWQGWLGALQRVKALRAQEEGKALPDIEVVAAAVHEAWMQQKRAKGITTALSQSTGEEQMRPYRELSHEVQEYDRATVRAVYNAIQVSALRAATTPQKGWQPIETAPVNQYEPFILAAWPHEDGYEVGEAVLEPGGWMACSTGDLVKPTHWQALPPPPVAAHE